MRPVAVAAVLAVTMLFATSAHADERRWYGWQGLGADAAATVMFVAAAEATEDIHPPLFIPGLLIYGLGGPISHFAHGETRRGFDSLALRVGLPLVTMFVVVGTAEKCFEQGCEPDFELAGVSGVAVAVSAALFDDLVLGWERVPSVPSAPSWTPAVAPAPGGMTLGLAGTW